MQFLLLNLVNAHPKQGKIVQMNPQKNNLQTSIKHHNCIEAEEESDWSAVSVRSKAAVSTERAQNLNARTRVRVRV
jgi:hypothetical protein